MRSAAVLSTVAIISSIAAIVQLTRVTAKLSEITVYDIDLVRETFLTEVQFAYMTGCRRAVDKYAPQDRNYYSPDSPMKFCDTWREQSEDYWLREAGKLGRKDAR